MVALIIYQTVDGKVPFDEWLADLKNVQVGNFGYGKPLHEGVQELRIDHGLGYRAYLSRQGPVVVLLFCGSDKPGQRGAIKRALAYLNDWRERGEP